MDYQKWHGTSTGDIFFNSNDEPIYIGKSNNFWNTFSNFKGEIDDVMFYNRELSEEEIKQLSNWK